MKVQVSLTSDLLARPGVIQWKELGYVFPSDAQISVILEPGVTPVVPPPITIVTPPPVDGTMGHMVIANPPMSATGIDTEFGYRDPGDNGRGFFTDPATGSPYNTDNVTLIGISLPREVLLSTFGISDDWRTSPINSVWAKNAAAVQKFAHDNAITSDVDGGGLSLRAIPLVDAGPVAGLASLALIDLTYGAALALKTGGKAKCTFEILRNGIPMELKGIIFDKGTVG